MQLRFLVDGGLAEKEKGWALEALEPRTFKSGERQGAGRGEKEDVVVASPNVPA